ncbi:hypothetical protein SAMN06265221_11820 [Paracoccus laeviglucosivorans]|uniref:Uncharacterized protein n=2 Tax=Paracoccus laeviglucosivorans TaxID=1197861 RepID=A0A521F4W4_9RHOB|nr:hypothetical protein SAMN06265221_11820 [Paracoccus laeviglucosivorans]
MLQRYPVHAISTAMPVTGGQLFSIKLIDRRTGEVPKLNGNPISFLTSTPRQAVEELLRGRDRENWTAQVDPVGPMGQPPATAGLGKANPTRRTI